MDASDLFLPGEDPPPPPPRGEPWKILVVDDDPQVFAATRVVLRDRSYEGRAFHMIRALSAAEARGVLASEDDIALALVDVVMETDTAGLDLVKHIRSEYPDRHMRVVLRTGQAGRVPEETVMIEYEIDGYASKTEMTSVKMFTMVVAALRTFSAMQALAHLNEELEVRVAQRTAELEHLAMIDPLTGVPNRRHFDARAEMEIQAARRDGRERFVVSIDIDHFKRINDTHGHAAGDAVLKAVAQTLTRSLRPGDFCCRMGGEEFVLLLSDLSPEGAEGIAARLCTTVAQAVIVWEDVTIPVTASVGLARLDPGETSIDAVLERADQAMYRAKREGRNRIAVAA